MKIGILTLVFNNYGTRLQSFALVKTINKLLNGRAEIEVVDIEGCWSNRNQSPKALAIKKIKAYGFKGFVKIFELCKWIYTNRKNSKVDHAQERKKRDKLFEKLNHMIPYTKTFYSCDDIRAGKLPYYDIIIVGSDQVWNGIKVGNQDVYMLDFLKGRKGLTYAASFGMTKIPSDQFEDYRSRINNFSNLLIREKEGVEMCRLLGRKDAHLVLDPTLLLQKEDYKELLNNATLDIEDDFILVYSLNQSYKIYDEAYKLAKRNGYTMIVLKRSFCPPEVATKYPGAKEFFAVSPEDFLWLIDNAKCVVTNSYHALLFSVNFSSPFYLYLDNADEENSRLLTLTSLLNLEEQVFWESGHLPKSVSTIDYTQPHNILNQEREMSIKLLKESIENK
jgi:hypothetical protein